MTETIKIPDGTGGWTEVEAARVEGQKANMDKAQAALSKEQDKSFFVRVGKCTTDLNKFLQIYARDWDLTKEEVVAAVYLENINNRHFFPGGPTKFDELCKAVWDWFQDNKNR